MALSFCKIRLLTAGLILWGTVGLADQAATPDTSAPSGSGSQEVMDLGADAGESFTPYSNERNPLWALLPALGIAIVLLHLRKSKPPQQKLNRRHP
jgi:hypothetical protein